MSFEEITVADGKYTVQIGEGEHAGKLKALRDGEPWVRDIQGDNLVYWLTVELRNAREALAQARAAEHAVSQLVDIRRELEMSASLMDEASGILEAVGPDVSEKVANWRWPLTDELGGAAGILRDRILDLDKRTNGAAQDTPAAATVVPRQR